jgi:hypothetical protein
MAAVVPVPANKCVGNYANYDENLGGSVEQPNIQLYCLKPNGVYTCATWRKFRVSCPKVNFQCSTLSEAWVAAVTVCNQQLF